MGFNSVFKGLIFTYKRSLGFATIVQYELLKLKHSKALFVRNTFTQTMYKSVFNWQMHYVTLIPSLDHQEFRSS